MKACEHGFRVAFATAQEWVSRLEAAQDRNRLEDELRRLERYHVLVVDEVGYLPLDRQAANLLFALVSPLRARLDRRHLLCRRGPRRADRCARVEYAWAAADSVMRAAMGYVVHPTVRSFLEHYRSDDVVGVPIRDMPPSETALVWLTARTSSKIEEFARRGSGRDGHTGWRTSRRPDGAVDARFAARRRGTRRRARRRATATALAIAGVACHNAARYRVRSHMSFDVHAGTRGGWQPGAGGPIGRWYTRRVVNRIRRKGKVMGLNALVLTTIGRGSGAERTTPVAGWLPGEDGTWLIVAAANGGARNPAWYYNIAARPDKVQIETSGRRVAVIAEQLHGPERDEAWRQIAAASARFAKYQQKTDRQLPIIRLTPRPESGQSPASSSA